MTLDLPPNLQARINEGAARQSLSPEAHALEVLETATSPPPPPGSGADLVDYWEREGVLGIWADRTDIPDSPEYARELRQLAERRTPEERCAPAPTHHPFTPVPGSAHALPAGSAAAPIRPGPPSR